VGIGVALATQLSVVALSPAAPVAARAASPRVTATSSLPAVNSGARPGPDLLYAAPPDAPQLQNVAPWHADPVLVSGAEAYRGGEFLYQDYLFDDRGAVGFAPIFPIVADPTDPFDPVANLFSPKHGTVTYPTDTATYANNAADLVELRVKPETNDTAFRVTLNSLKDAGKVGFTIALGTSASALPWPASAGVKSPAEFFLTVHGATGTLVHAVGLTPVAGPAPTVAVDLARRQVDVRVPHSLWTPTATVRMAAGVGLWDTTANIYAQPGAVASATQPGGCPTGCPALFNMAFRTAEPLPKIYSPGGANTIAEGGVGVKIDGTWWREKQQADVLATGDVTPFSALVDFTKLGNGTNEELGPRSGHLDRIMASHFSFGQGVDYNVKCFPSNPAECTGRLIGQLQPYAVYVPAKPIPAAGFGLVLSMHGLSANFNEFLGSHEAEQLGNRGTGSILASPEGRGPDGFYHYYAEADAFEMWADLARHYKLNPDLTDVSGYSMGGEGTYLLATRWPDLFGKAFPIVGPPSSSGSYKSLRNIPVMAWYGQTDELVGPQDSEQSFLNAFQAGIRYDHWVFTPAGHITEGNNDEYTPAAVFLGNTTVDRSPPHVTYFRDPSLDTRALSAPDHAYWVSGITLASGSATGTIDAKSHGFGVDDAPVLAPQLGAGILTGGSHPLGLPYTERILSWGATPSAPVANRLDVTVSGVSAATVDLARARLDCNVDLHVVTDVTTTIHFTSCSRVVTTAANYGPNALGGGGLPNTSPGGPLGPVVVLIVVVMGGGAALAARRVRQYNPWGLNRR
jgi:hypothetical protein